ncbi:MAG: HAMP domain-containing protein [Thermoanaerobaculia bacterium]|nr:HAMP domain-containing protein [Thermoanaerobaculia bacterium]
MRGGPLLRQLSLTSRLGLAFTAILAAAAVAQTVLYLRFQDQMLTEADASYKTLATAIQAAATRIGPGGSKDPKALEEFREKLRQRGVREIRIKQGGLLLPDGSEVGPPAPGRKRTRGAAVPQDIEIEGVVGEGPGSGEIVVPLVIERRYLGQVTIKYSLENIRAELEGNFRRGLYALLGVFAVGLVVILVVTRNATKPVEAVAEAARQVADGRLDVVVPVDRADEIGQLAVAFNRMTSALRERQDLLARLAAAEKRAEIGHLAAGLAHEIKNPLNALSLGLDVLRRRHRPADEDAAADQAARIEALRGEIDRLATLINNFLAFGRPLSLTVAPVDAVALVRDTLADLSETAEQARVKLETALPGGLPRVLADGSLLKSAVWNLAQNGIQGMEREGGTLHVSARQVAPSPDEGPRLVLAFEDEGHGIDVAHLPRLFEPWFSTKEGGVGLGLAMVKRIVEEHGGRVEAENREGARGAAFRIWLPLALPPSE